MRRFLVSFTLATVAAVVATLLFVCALRTALARTVSLQRRSLEGDPVARDARADMVDDLRNPSQRGRARSDVWRCSAPPEVITG